MKSKSKRSLRIFGVLLVTLLITLALFYFSSINYKYYPLQVDKSKFPGISSNEQIDALAEALVDSMSLDEKIGQLYGNTMFSAPKLAINLIIQKRFPHVYVGRNDRLNIPPWVLSDGPRGVRVMDRLIDGVTNFPVAMARGASWDTDLERRVNEVIAIEMRANGANYAATPCINLLRHPGWGRAQETYGEDPWLLGEFGVAAVQGIQKHNVMACPKHFALNSIENSRHVIDVQLSERALREVYLPHFRKTLMKGKSASLMSAYNSVNGAFCSNNKYLLNDILREEWGFEGFVSSDWFYGTTDGIASIKAGLDVEMPFQQMYANKVIGDGIKEGLISESDVDKIVKRSLKTRLKYAFATDEMTYGLEQVGSQEHIDLARETAQKSMVLIKNEQVLPFNKKSGKTIAVIGRLANLLNTGDRGSSNAKAKHIVTPYEGLVNYHKKRGNTLVLYDGKNPKEAAKIAESADDVILVVGFTFEDEGEYMVSASKMEKSADAGKPIGDKGSGGDRENLSLRPIDEKLIHSVAKANDNVVIVYVGGSAIDMNAWENEAKAILFAWYAGMEGGNALANILYGDVNPSGKLPFSIARNDSDYPLFTPYAHKVTYGYYHGYTLFEKENIEVAWPFGHGLSYTQFEYSDIQLENENISLKDTLRLSVLVQNTGKMAGEEVVQLYVGFSNSKVDRPVKLLRDFKKLSIQSGETKELLLKVAVDDLAWYDPAIKKWVVDQMEYELFVGGSSDSKNLLTARFFVGQRND
jgi:beta-glucosidase